jgi:hypothetical protein
MKHEKKFDCVNFKHELQRKLRKDSGAKNLSDYIKYINEVGTQSPLWNKDKHNVSTNDLRSNHAK